MFAVCLFILFVVQQQHSSVHCDKTRKYLFCPHNCFFILHFNFSTLAKMSVTVVKKTKLFENRYNKKYEKQNQFYLYLFLLINLLFVFVYCVTLVITYCYYLFLLFTIRIDDFYKYYVSLLWNINFILRYYNVQLNIFIVTFTLFKCKICLSKQ